MQAQTACIYLTTLTVKVESDERREMGEIMKFRRIFHVSRSERGQEFDRLT